jgi:hypothetical protein
MGPRDGLKLTLSHFRLKRGNSIVSLYHRLYEREKLLELLRIFGRRMRQRSRRLLWGGAFIGFYDWTEGIPVGEMRRHCREIEICKNLTQVDNPVLTASSKV